MSAAPGGEGALRLRPTCSEVLCHRAEDRDETPVLVTDDLEPHWLVPLSVMRRKTQVNVELSDEEDRSISMLGARFNQHVDKIAAARRRRAQ